MPAAACFWMGLMLLAYTAHGQEYIIGEGDLLKITVYDSADLTSEVRVGGEGRITLPLIGDVMVKGLTGAETGRKVAAMLADGYIKNPQVSIFILEYKSKKVTVLGEFTRPGLVEMRGDSTLMEVISSAGGVSANAGETLFIQRNVNRAGSGPREEMTIPVDLTRLMESGDTAMNIQVLDGDSIYVPRAAFVYVTGEVKNPGAFKIVKGLTVLRSITLAGGFTLKANKNKPEIIRKTETGEKTLRVAMDDLVAPDDIIVVPESYF